MPVKRHSAEQIVRKLREAEVELARGATVKDACRKLSITEHTYYRWRREYGGLKLVRAILEEVAEYAPAVVVMGSHGRSKLDHLLLGSVAERVLRKAPCAVLTVKF